MELSENLPLNTHILADLIETKDDMLLVWPDAKYPFCHDQWRTTLNPDKGHRSLLVYLAGRCIAHAALIKARLPRRYKLSFFYVVPEMRYRGIGQEVIELLEDYAREKLTAQRLDLNVRTYNPAALRCYEKSGFREMGREGSLVKMSKRL